MKLGKVQKDTTDVTRVVVDCSKWLDQLETITTVGTPTVVTDYSTGAVPQGDGQVLYPPDSTTLVVDTPAIVGTNSVNLMLHAGTPTLSYWVEFLVTGSSGRVKTLELHVECKALIPTPSLVNGIYPPVEILMLPDSPPIDPHRLWNDGNIVAVTQNGTRTTPVFNEITVTDSANIVGYVSVDEFDAWTADLVTGPEAAALAPVQSVATRKGDVTLTHNDITDWNTAAPAAAPVRTVATRTGDVVLSHNDITDWASATQYFVTYDSIAVAGYAPLNSPHFTGVPTVPTPAIGQSDGQIINASWYQQSMLRYAPLDSPALINTPTAPTPPLGDNSGRIATTAFMRGVVTSAVAGVSYVNNMTGNVTLVAGNIPDFDAAASAAAPVQTVAGRKGNVTIAAGDVSGLGQLATAVVGPGLAVNNGTASATVSSINVIGNYDAVTNTPSLSNGGRVNGVAGVANSGFAVVVGGTVAADGVGVVSVSDIITNVGGSLWIGQHYSGVYGSMAVQNANNVAINGGSIVGQTVLGLSNGDSLQPSGTFSSYAGLAVYYADASGRVPWFIDNAGTQHSFSLIAGTVAATGLISSTATVQNGATLGSAILGGDVVTNPIGLNRYISASFYVVDAAGYIPFYIDNVGTSHIGALTAPVLSTTTVTTTVVNTSTLSVQNTATIPALFNGVDVTSGVSNPINNYAGLAFYVTDASGRVPWYIDFAGGLHTNSLVLSTIIISGAAIFGSAQVGGDIWSPSLGITATLYSYYVVDTGGRVTFGITPKGETQAASLYAALAAHSVATGLTSTGSTQAGAYAVTAWLNEFINVPNGSGTVLSDRTGRETIIINSSATQALSVYPRGSAAIGGLAPGAPTLVAPSSMMLFFQSATDKYYPLAISGGGGGGMTGSSGLAEIAAAGTQAQARKNLNIPGDTVSAADPAYGIRFDLQEGTFAVTATSGSTTLTIANNANFSGITVSMAAGSKTLVLTAANDKIFRISPQPRDVGKPIAIPAAGIAGGWLVTTITQVVGTGTTQQQIFVADAAITAVTDGAYPIFPCFLPSDAAKKMLIPGWGSPRLGKSVPATIGGAGAYEPAIATIATYVAPNQVTLNLAAPVNYAATQGFRIFWGTDNTTALLAFFQDAINKRCRYGSFPNLNGVGVGAFNWAANSVYGNVICVGDSKTTLALFDNKGYRFRRRIIPLHSTYKRPPRRSLISNIHLKRVTAAATPVFAGCGDSMYGADPAGKAPYSESPWAITVRGIQNELFDKNPKFLERSIGATDWTDFWRTDPGAYDITSWFQAGQTWNAQLAVVNAGGPADCYLVGQSGGNGANSIYEPSVRAQIGFIRSLAADGSGNRPDIVMMAQGARELFDGNGSAPAIDYFHYAGRFLQSYAQCNGCGFLPFASNTLLMRDGIDPDFFYPRGTMPPNTQPVGPNTAASFGYTVYNWIAQLGIISTTIADAWNRVGTLSIQLSPKVDNVLQLSSNVGNTILRWQINTWGMPSTCTPTMTLGNAALATAGQRSVTVTPSNGAAADNLLHVAEAGTFVVGDVGKCFYLSAGNLSGAPWRCWIIGFVDGQNVYLSEPVRFNPVQPAMTALIGGLSFIPEDAYGTHIQIPGADAAGALLDTTIVGYTDAQHVTLAVPAGTAVSASASVWLGRICARGTVDTSTNPPGTTLNASPNILFEVAEDQLIAYYNYFAGKAPGAEIFRGTFERYGGPYVPHVWCSGSGPNAQVSWSAVAVDEPIPTMQEVLDYEAWAPDTTNSYEHGGSGTGHMAAGLGPLVYEPVVRAQKWR